MALNSNHAFEDLGEVKCSIAEKNCRPERAEFLKRILEHNHFTVVVVNSPALKAAKVPVKAAEPGPEGASENPAAAVPEPPPAPVTFTVGVTDLTFNPMNAIFNRELITLDGAILNLDYWKQRSDKVTDEYWYWDKTHIKA